AYRLVTRGAKGLPSTPATAHRRTAGGSRAVRVVVAAGALIGFAGADGGQTLFEWDLEPLGAGGVGVEALDPAAIDLTSYRALDVANLRLILGCDERVGIACRLGARSAADPVDVVVGCGRHV